jgi:hypothetical protein
VIVRPGKKLTVRGDVHSLQLAKTNDPCTPAAASYSLERSAIRDVPRSASRRSGTVCDASGDYALTPHLAISGYYGQGQIANNA